MHVILHTKQDCQLCDALKFELLDLQLEHGFAFSERFVDADATASTEAAEIPFVEIAFADRDSVLLTAPVSQPALRRRIQAESQREINAHG